MKKIILFFTFCSSLFSVSYSTLYSSGGLNYKNSIVYINGDFNSYRCIKDRRINGHRVDGYCKVQLSATDRGSFISYVSVVVGTTWESDFKSAKRGDFFSFSCTYRHSIINFKDCN